MISIVFLGMSYFCCFWCKWLNCRLQLAAYYCEKIRVFQADVYLNSSAWNNGIGEIALSLVLGWFLMMNRDSWGH